MVDIGTKPPPADTSVHRQFVKAIWFEWDTLVINVVSKEKSQKNSSELLQVAIQFSGRRTLLRPHHDERYSAHLEEEMAKIKTNTSSHGSILQKVTNPKSIRKTSNAQYSGFVGCDEIRSYVDDRSGATLFPRLCLKEVHT